MADKPVRPGASKPAAKPAVKPAAKPAAKPVAKPLASRPAPAKAAAAAPGALRSSGEQKALAAKARPVGEAAGGEENEDEGSAHATSFLMFQAVPSWLTSMVVHIIALLVLALLTIDTYKPKFDNELTIGNTEEESEEIEMFEEEELMEPIDMEVTSSDVSVQPITENIAEEPVITDANDLDAAPIQVELNPLGADSAPKNDLLKEIGSYTGTGLSGRGAAARSQLVREGGGTKGSEEAVARALKWFKNHQNPNGSWSFRHLNGVCPCPNHGTPDAVNGATAMALLPYLGAGNTHMEGAYKEQVRAGLYFLVSSQKPNGSFHESGGNMYSHGLCAIALCEAYAMTQDRSLMAPAQAALNFIVYAQDPVGGGWRYLPKQRGDTSVVGWQLMALKSGHMAYLRVPPNVVIGASKFLDSVQSDSGSAYGYADPGNRGATNAIGLLCRMYLGWKHEEPALKRGVERISNSGPSTVDMYYNYYATQVMRHFEGEEWKKWNPQMRDQLVNTQAKSGHMEGSWFAGSGHANERGGRLYFTSMATMILEVYYRHLPIYRKQAAEDEFQL